MRLFGKLLQDHLMNGGEIKIPHIGKIFFFKERRKHFPVDWKASREAHARIYHTNSHTMGYIICLSWWKPRAKYKKYKLTTNKLLKTAMARKIKEDKHHYKLIRDRCSRIRL